jgi:uncharacterized repeat protein (TIGR01451 family)
MGRLLLATLAAAIAAICAAPAGAAPAQSGLTCKYGFKYVVKIVHGKRKRVKVCKPKPKAKPQADLELTITTPAQGQVTVGNLVAYTLVVENKGPAAAQGVTVTLDLPAGEPEIYSSGDGEGEGCEFTGPVGGPVHVTCTFGELVTESEADATGGSPYLFVHVVVEPSSAGDTVVHGHAAASTVDPHPENNDVSAPLRVVPGPASADLSLALTGSTGGTVPDGYDETMSVTNHGPTEATEVYVTTLLPQGSTLAVLPPFFDIVLAPFVPSGLCSIGIYPFLNSSVACFDSIAPGETQSKTVRILPSIRTPTTLQTDAVVSAYTRDPDLSNNRASSTTTVAPFTPAAGPDIRVSLEPPAHAKAGPIAVPFRLENLGLGDLEGVEVTATLSPNLGDPTLLLVSNDSALQCSSTDGTSECLLESIESDSRQLGAVIGTAAAGSYSVTVTVTASNLPTPVSDTATFQVG